MNKQRFFIVITLFVLITGAVAYSQQKQSRPYSRRVSTILRNEDLFWVNAPWTASDAPYIAMGKEIDEEIANGKTQKNLINEKDQLSLAHPHDPKSAYAWAYVALKGLPYDAYTTHTEVAPARERCFALIDAIKDKPLSYEYARVLFLTTSRWAPVVGLLPLGQRLLARNPNDDPVKFRVIGMLTQTGKPADEDLAMKYAESFLQRFPQRCSSHEYAGLVYSTMFFSSKDISMGNKAVVELQQARKLLDDSAADNQHKEDIDFLINATKKQITKVR